MQLTDPPNHSSSSWQHLQIPWKVPLSRIKLHHITVPVIILQIFAADQIRGTRCYREALCGAKWEAIPYHLDL